MKCFKQQVERLLQVDIVKVFSLNALSTFIHLLAGMVSVKVVALIIGPVGIALLGQLNNFNTILLGLANGGIKSGITKYVAQYREDDKALKKYLSNALRITLFCSLIISVLLIFGCYQLSELILLSSQYYYVFIVFGLTLTLYSLNGFFISVLNGFKQFRKYVEINIAGTIIGLLYSLFLVFEYGLSGALLNAVTFQSVVFFATLWMCRKQPWLRWDNFKEKIDKTVARNYFGFSLMTITSLALLPLSQLFIRGYVIAEISASDAGVWEGINRVSNTYLSVITTALSVYYLPRLSEISDKYELHKEIIKCYKFIVPVLIVIGMSIYFLRSFIVWLLFTPDFCSMENLFPWQLIGDFFKITSWILSFIMVAKARTKMFIITEILFSVSYLFFSLFFLRWNGIVGLTQAYFCNYFIYMLTMLYLFRNLVIFK